MAYRELNLATNYPPSPDAVVYKASGSNIGSAAVAVVYDDTKILERMQLIRSLQTILDVLSAKQNWPIAAV